MSKAPNSCGSMPLVSWRSNAMPAFESIEVDSEAYMSVVSENLKLNCQVQGAGMNPNEELRC